VSIDIVQGQLNYETKQRVALQNRLLELDAKHTATIARLKRALEIIFEATENSVNSEVREFAEIANKALNPVEGS
jgi:hypothetical protein